VIELIALRNGSTNPYLERHRNWVEVAVKPNRRKERKTGEPKNLVDEEGDLVKENSMCAQFHSTKEIPQSNRD